MSKIFETHAHYDDEQYDKDREIILPVLHQNGIEYIVNIAYDKKSNEAALTLAHEYPFVYATVGYHPCDCGEMTEADIDEMRQRAKDPKVVAVGEIGLDYYWDDVDREVQKHWFIRQIQVAQELKLPIVIHSREAAQDTFDILKNYGDGNGVMHCYAYSVEMAREYVKLGYYLGVGGVVTFKNAKNIKEVVREIPMEHLLLETDSPYLTPTPFRGKRNSSANLVYVAEEIARIKGISYDEVTEITRRNAMAMYGIDAE